MYYVCLENDAVISILSYEPQVPSTVTVIAISDSEYNCLEAETHRFDIPSKVVVPVDASIQSRKEQEQLNAVEREFLNSTDWKILRHIRQKSLGIATSLTEAEYLALEQDRNNAANRII